MSLLGKYRKEEEARKDDDEDKKETETAHSATTTPPAKTRRVSTRKETKQADSVPNKERKSPIVSFSISTELRSCLQSVRNERAINLSMWVERKLREAITSEFPDIANQYLD